MKRGGERERMEEEDERWRERESGSVQEQKKFNNTQSIIGQTSLVSQASLKYSTVLTSQIRKKDVVDKKIDVGGPEKPIIDFAWP